MLDLAFVISVKSLVDSVEPVNPNGAWKPGSKRRHHLGSVLPEPTCPEESIKIAV